MTTNGVAVASNFESRGLTGLRGLGALMVMLHHFSLVRDASPQPAALNGVLLKGYLGVDLFFVLSGFVMAMVYGDWFPGGATDRLRRAGLFLVRRAARIWPLHVAVLAVTIALASEGGLHFSPRVIIANVVMVQAWGISRAINPPAWSISTEFFAYLLFPLLAGPVLRGRLGGWLALAGIAALLAIDLALAPGIGAMRRGQLDIYFNDSLLPVLRCLAGFTLGLLTWRLGQASAVRRRAGSALAGPVALGVMLALMLVKANDLLIYPLLPAIVLGFHFGRGPAWQALARGPIYRLGVLSYAIYLVHYTLLRSFTFGWGPLWAELGAFLLAAIGIAALTHAAIELPARRAIRAAGLAMLPRFGRRLPGRPPLQPGSG